MGVYHEVRTAYMLINSDSNSVDQCSWDETKKTPGSGIQFFYLSPTNGCNFCHAEEHEDMGGVTMA